MMIISNLNFSHPHQYYDLPHDFIGRWKEYEKAKNAGLARAQNK